MSLPNKLGPFWPQLRLLYSDHRSAISPEHISMIFRNVDCIKYHREFIFFVENYWDSIILDQKSILSTIRLCAVLEHKEFDVKSLLDKLVSAYENNIVNQSIKEIDIDMSLNFTRYLIDSGRSIDLLLTIICAKIESLDKSGDLTDHYNVIINNHDVIESIYSIETVKNYGLSLDQSIRKVFLHFIPSGL